MREIVLCALATAIILIGSVVVGGALGAFVNGRLPGHSTDPSNVLLSAIPALGCVIAGGAAWGWAISRITRKGEAARMARGGACGFGPTLLFVALALTFLENLIVEQGKGPQLPIHIVFTLLFAPAAAIIAGVGTWAIAIGARAFQANRLAWICAFVAGGVLLSINLILDSAGFRVGAPGAEERLTMLTTAFVGNFTAALAGGGVIGAGLRNK